jgi:hypothetical protein
VARGEPRFVRRTKSRCRFLPVTQVCPTAIPRSSRHPRRLSPAWLSDDRRARVLGPSEGRVSGTSVRGFPCRSMDAWLCERTLTTFPSSAPKRHPLSPARSLERGETLPRVTDRPRPPFHRPPAKDDGFQTIRMPSTVAISSGREDRSSRLPEPVSRSRRPHFVPRLGRVLFRALQARSPV